MGWRIIALNLKQLLYGVIILSSTVGYNDAWSSWNDLRFSGIKKQKYDSTCGIASLSMVFRRYFDIEKDEIELISYFSIKPEYSFLDIADVASQFSVKTIGVKITRSQLKAIRSPAILFLKRFGKGHFVVLKGVNEGWVQIEDPAWGTLNYTSTQFDRYWLQSDGLGRVLIFNGKKENIVDEKKIYSKIILSD